MNFAQAMTYDSLSHTAYDVATTIGATTTPRGGYKNINIDIKDRKFSTLAAHRKFGSQGSIPDRH